MAGRKRAAKAADVTAAAEGGAAAGLAGVAAAEAAMARATVDLLLREPFFGHVLGGMSRHFTDGVETMAVALRGDTVQLLVNPTFVTRTLRRAGERAAVVKHEVLHVVCKHLFRPRDQQYHPRLWNIAADLVVNQFVAPFELPEGALGLSTFPDLGLKPDETVEAYYRQLRRLQEGLAPTAGGGDGSGDSPGGPDASGEAGRGELTGLAAKAPQSARALERLLSAGSDPSDHSRWRAGRAGAVDGVPTGGSLPEEVAAALAEWAEVHTLRAAERVERAAGTLPGWVQRLVAEARARRQARMDWRRVLRLFAASSRKTRIVTTQRKESRRFEPVPGVRRFAGLKVKRYQRVAVVIDTSGSIGDAELGGFFDEIRGILSTGAEVQVIECDAKVQRSYPLSRAAERFSGKVRGGGGTDFEPALRWLVEARPQRFDACIYLTDGHGPAPTTRPPCPLLWVVTDPAGLGEHLRFGRAVCIA